MDFLISFLEGIITFISPCLLPMIPIYISFFAGQATQNKKARTIVNACGFVLGFTIIFVLMGAFAGTLGKLLKEYSVVVNLIMGILLVLFGLSFMEVIKIPLIGGTKHLQFRTTQLGLLRSVLFGIVFSLGWTPCVSAFLGSALMLAASQGESLKGILMLLSFSLGLGIPFIASAVLIDKLKKSFNFIKQHYKIINRISGGFLILIGILMATGRIGYFLGLLTF